MKSVSKKYPTTSAKKQVKKNVDHKNELSIAKRLLQVEAALEKVRKKALQMKRTDELKAVISIIFKEMGMLGFDLYDTNIAIVDKATKDITFYGSGLGGVEMPPEFKVPYLPGEEPYFDRVYEDLRRMKAFRSSVLEGERLKDYHKFALEKTDFKDAPKKYLEEMLSVKKVVLSYATMSHGFLEVASDNVLDEDKIDILKRFASVVDLTYTRFDDLQKAETQAREAQIEAALERIRSASMAMHKSEELPQVALTFLIQIEELAIPVLGVALSEINIETKTCITYFADNTTEDQIRELSISKEFKIHEFWLAKEAVKQMKSGKKEFSITAEGERLELWIKWIDKIFSKKRAERLRSANLDKVFFHTYQFHEYSSILFSSLQPLSEEYRPVIQRLVSTFKLSYLRFLDLQQAEAQARESEIQLALERVRARTMAMHNSEELAETAAVLFQQIYQLDTNLERMNIGIVKEDQGIIEFWSTEQGGKQIDRLFKADIKELSTISKVYAGWKSGKKTMVIEQSGRELKQWLRYLKQEIKMPFRDELVQDKRFHSIAFFSAGMILTSSPQPLAEGTLRLLPRFAMVFEQTYTRFLDLQKAEAQAREGEIQLALERVRAQTMAMHSSKDIGDCILKMFGELTSLGVDEGTRFGIGILNHDNENNQLWTALKEGEEIKMHVGNLDMTSHPLLKSARKAWKEQVPLHRYVLEGDDLLHYYQMLNTAPDYKIKVEIEKLPKKEFHYGFVFEHGFFYAFSLSEFQQDLIQIAQRFSAVFEQTYRRFLDLQKAEAQAREAEIQLALERVRAKTMAMQNSSDLADASVLMANQVRELGIKAWGCAFHIYADNEDGDYEWFSSEDGYLPFYKTPREGVFKRYYENRQSGEPLYIEEFSGEACTRHYEYLMTLPVVGDALRSLRDSGVPLPTSQIDHVVYFSYGYLLFITYEPVPEAYNIFKRFAKEFEQTYTRFLDLKKVEEQAREAQIEAALERVRAQAMAMYNSENLLDAISEFFSQLKLLDVVPVRCGVAQMFDDPPSWIAAATNATMHGSSVQLSGLVDNLNHPVLQGIFEHWKKQKSYFPILKGEDIKKYYSVLRPQIAIPKFPKGDIHHGHYFFFQEGCVFAWTPDPLTKDEIDIFERFSSVLSLTYRRYLDLKESENQAREAQIEASLEKVRGKAMAMHNSEDLSSTASMVFTELRNLGIRPIRCGVGLFNNKSRKVQLYSATSDNNNDSLALIGWVVLSGHPVFEKIYEAWLKNKEYFPEMSGEQLKSYYDLLLKGFPVEVSDFPEEQKQYGHFLPISVGCLYAWSDAPYDEDQLKIIMRFATIIDLTFRRYFELRKSEAIAKEAIKQAALDRIRAEIASMRTSKDLNRITPVIWRELKALEVPFFRCGVFIIDEETKKIDSYLSNPKGESLAAWRSDYDTLPLFKALVKAWKKQQVYRTEWDKSQFMEFSKILIEQGLVRDVKRYQAGRDAPDYLSLQMIPFKQGMLYVGSAEHLNSNQIELAQSLASAFSIAYSRYEDFRQLEIAKSEIEQTLSELKSTQNQLIHSEKMASLGELTAGIAHEIQNPLNFVNNFSEVSKELIEELKEERAKQGQEHDKGLEEEIIEDIIQNLEKINHHGQRASSIVKGMLEHSRTSNREKELTDINILADEYLRLAYHGLRAKDKSFNADFKTELDPSLPKVKVIGQDIGRVLLNLINNAFYAVSKRSIESTVEYRPEVLLKTKKNDKTIEITVQDNGGGIPKNVLDKIYQPFFTTKPTGQGTGLGLSLSYDIITKGHDGHLEVETQEGLGTEFIIKIPIT